MEIVADSKARESASFDDFGEERGQGFPRALPELLEMRDLELAGELRNDRYRNVGRRKMTVFAGGVFVMFRRRYYYDRIERRYLFPLDVVLGIPPSSSTTDAESARIASMAMEMPYSAVARWASRGPDTISASTVCRRVAACEVVSGERKAGLRPDGTACEAMIDEKYVPIWHEKGKRPIYTATLHAGLKKGPGGRDSLRNKTVLCSLDCLELRKMVAEAAEASYSASSAPERFVSGDLAPYIRSFPGSEEGPGFRYVPDKWHVCRACSLLSPGGKRVKAAGVKAFLSSIERKAREGVPGRPGDGRGRRDRGAAGPPGAPGGGGLRPLGPPALLRVLPRGHELPLL